MFAAHLTALPNLLGIVRHGGLWSDERFRSTGVSPLIITDQGIKLKRSRYRIDCSGRTLSEYVPFFFVPGNATTYRVCRGNDPSTLMYLVVETADFVHDEDALFTDRHPLSERPAPVFRRDLSGVGKVIDQRGLIGRFWGDDGDLRKRMEAELLIWMRAPLSKMHGLAVHSERAKVDLEHDLIALGWKDHPPIKSKPAWFFC